MEEIKIDDNNKENPQQTYKINSESIQTKNSYISMMAEEETTLWFKKLNLDEELLTQLEKVVKNGKDLISIYENNKILEKFNIDLHSINIINNAIEEGLEEQLKINILIQKEKNIILNVENEPKFKLKEILSYLEKLLKKTVYLTPLNSPNELLTPNTLIVKKILLNPNKYCNLQLFDEKSISNNTINTNLTSIPDSKTKNIPYTKLDNININITKKEIPVLSGNDNDKLNLNLNNQNIQNIGKGYVSLFQNNKNNLPDFTTDYKMPSQNRSNTNNFIKLETKNITPSKPIEDFKYHNILSKKDNNKEEKEEKNIINDIRFLNENNNINNEPKNIGFKNITNIKNLENPENEFNIMNKNYFTQRNFSSKTISNEANNNNLMLQQILNKKRNEKNISDMMGKRTIDNIEEDNTNLSFLERNKIKERDSFKFGKENNEIKKQTNNKTENRYEFSRLQDLDKDNIYGNKNIFNYPKTNPENNDIDNLIIKNQNQNINQNINDELINSKDKYNFMNNNININNNIKNNQKEDIETDILKTLREKYSLNKLNQENESNNNNKINIELKKDYKPKTPINEARRNMADNRFNNIVNENSNNPLENKFLMKQNDDFSQFNNFLNNNNLFKIQQDDDNNNIVTKIRVDKIGKNRMNRPSSGLELNSFQYKAVGYKSSFQQKEGNDSNQINQEDE